MKMNEITFNNLKECPFCGNEFAEVVVKSYYHRQLGRQYFVECTKCGATSKHSDVEEAVVQLWNTRI